MSVVLILADQPRRGADLVQRGVQIGSRLGAHGVECVYTHSPKDCALPGGIALGCPEFGIPSVPCWISDADHDETAGEVELFLRDCRIQVLMGGMDTRTANYSVFDSGNLQREFALADLLILSSEGHLQSQSLDLRRLLKLTTRPILMASGHAWERIVIAACNEHEAEELQFWAEAWSSVWNIPHISVRWRPKANRVWEWNRSCWWQPFHREVKFPIELKPTDLLLVGRSRGGGWRRQLRRALAWEILARQHGVSLGVSPLFYTPSVAALLHLVSAECSVPVAS